MNTRSSTHNVTTALRVLDIIDVVVFYTDLMVSWNSIGGVMQVQHLYSVELPVGRAWICIRGGGRLGTFSNILPSDAIIMGHENQCGKHIGLEV